MFLDFFQKLLGGRSKPLGDSCQISQFMYICYEPPSSDELSPGNASQFGTIGVSVSSGLILIGEK